MMSCNSVDDLLQWTEESLRLLCSTLIEAYPSPGEFFEESLAVVMGRVLLPSFLGDVLCELTSSSIATRRRALSWLQMKEHREALTDLLIQLIADLQEQEREQEGTPTQTQSVVQTWERAREGADSFQALLKRVRTSPAYRRLVEEQAQRLERKCKADAGRTTLN